MSVKSRLSRTTVCATVVGAALFGLAGTAHADPNAPYVGSGYTTSGAPVWCVQHAVNYIIKNHWSTSYYGPAPATIPEDSQWGQQTEQAVEAVQHAWGLTPDGVVGPDTGSILISYGDPYYTGSSNAYCYKYLPGVLWTD